MPGPRGDKCWQITGRWHHCLAQPVVALDQRGRPLCAAHASQLVQPLDGAAPVTYPRLHRAASAAPPSDSIPLAQLRRMAGQYDAISAAIGEHYAASEFVRFVQREVLSPPPNDFLGLQERRRLG